MKTADSGIATFLDANTAGEYRHILTVTPRTGSIVRWTDNALDLVVGGNTYRTGGERSAYPIVRLKKRREVAGLEIGSVTLELLCDDVAMFNAVPVPAFAAQRGFDGATILIERVLPASLSLGKMHYFQGYVGAVTPGGTIVTLEVESGIALLNVELPRIVFQPACTHMLYDAECTLSKASNTVTGTVSSGATTTSIPTSRTEATGTLSEAGWFGLGVITFTSGACNGLSRAVRKYVNSGGTFTPDRPLPVAPANGDTFSVYPGCTKTTAVCSNANTALGPAFNNLTHFRGFPYVPRNEAAF